MNLSLARDILKRNQGPGILTPPGCCLTFVDHPAPWLRQRMCVQVGIATEHRFAFWLWMRVKNDLRYDRRAGVWIEDKDFMPPDLLTMDWHDDVGGAGDFIESELCRLNQRDENEVGLYCWAGLHPLDDGQIAPAMWLNALGNVYVVTRHWDDPEPQGRAIRDRYGREHSVTYLRTPQEFFDAWQDADPGNGLIWDIDLDYFTESEEVPDQRYSPMLSDEAIAEALDPSQEWLQAVLANLRGISIALEPEYTGGLSNSLHLLGEWEKALFQSPLFDKHCRWRGDIEAEITGDPSGQSLRKEMERQAWNAAFQANEGCFKGGDGPMGAPHLLLLGAGASVAALPEGDKHGRVLPVMADFIEVVDGLQGYLDTAGISNASSNIEELYASLAEDDSEQHHLQAIEGIVFDYFASLELPDEPTLYDLMVLALRPKDMIATFNWDPFLVQAWNRVGNRIGLENLPRFAHLHGNVAEGHCADSSHDGKMVIGPLGTPCSCGKALQAGPLLYPIAQKNYSNHHAIRTAWTDLRTCLGHAYIFTIFGYSAPTSDVEAVAMLREAWGDLSKRELAQIEIVDIIDADALQGRWREFIVRDHYVVSDSWHRTFLSQHARRSCDALWGGAMELNPWTERPIPEWASWEELDEWLEPLLQEEHEK